MSKHEHRFGPDDRCEGCGCGMMSAAYESHQKKQEFETDLTVRISGKAGSGKTTLCLAFQAFLTSQGFTNVEVKVKDYDVENDSAAPEWQKFRIKAVQSRRILIETVQPKAETHQMPLATQTIPSKET